MARKSRKNLVIVDDEQNFIENRLIRTAIYLRLSVEAKRKKDENSIDNQRNIVENFIAVNPEFEIVAEFIDNGNTGTNFERDGFKTMINEVEKGNIDCIIVKDLSRFGRNVIDTGYYIEKFLLTHNVRFIAITDNFDTNDDSQGNIILPIKNMINEAYSRDLSRKIKSQKRNQMERGEWTSAAPYGYLKDENRRLVIDEEVAPIIRRMFELIENGALIQQIVRTFNSESVPSPLTTNRKLEKLKEKSRHEWQHTKIRKILRDELYIGNMIQGKTVSKNPDNWVRVNNSHKPIISEETFYNVQKILDVRLEKYNAIEKTPYESDIFKGKIYCKCCGRKMAYRRNKTSGYIYYCTTNSKLGYAVCVGTSISQDILQNLVVEFLEKQYEILLNNKKYNSIKDDTINDKNIEISILKNQIQKDKLFLKSLYENLVKEVLTKDDYTNLKNNYEERIFEKATKIKEIEFNNTVINKIKLDFQPLIKTKKLNKNIVDTVIDKIYVSKGRIIEIEYKFNVEEIDEVYNG